MRDQLHDTRPLAELDVLIVDCQATAAYPRGHLIELGWQRAGAITTPARAHLIAAAIRIPPSVTRITGISQDMVQHGVTPAMAWGELLDCAKSIAQRPTPTVSHFARFEAPFLAALAAGRPPLEMVCTHEIARRLLPELPRRSLRALAGYFGHGVCALRRSQDHVEATAFVWRELIPLLAAKGISTWGELRWWLATPCRPSRPARRQWPMPRELRLAVPDAPGIYRMLRKNGDVLYVGKATSLRHRVNSYFTKQQHVHERTLEMLSQSRALSFQVVASPLEAALLEPDEIKSHRPPYNIALAEAGREVWFASPDFSERHSRATSRFTRGPFASPELLDEFAALLRGQAEALGVTRWSPGEAAFQPGYAAFCAAHPELWAGHGPRHARLLQLGARLWREGRRDGDLDDDEGTATATRTSPAWTPERVRSSLEWLTLRTVVAVRRGVWLSQLSEATVAWSEKGLDRCRAIVIERGEITSRLDLGGRDAIPLPPGHAQRPGDRQAAFTVARFDRLRVLTTELKRLIAEGAPVVRFGPARTLSGPRLARVLSRL